MAYDRGDRLVRAVGVRVRELRKAAGLTLERLAEKLDVTPQWLSRIEKGEENLGLRTLSRLADALGVKARDLLPDEEVKTPRRTT